MAKWRESARLTTDQIEFAKTMTIKQRGVLHALSMFDCYMSASEIGDEELCELVRKRPGSIPRHSPALAGACRGA